MSRAPRNGGAPAHSQLATGVTLGRVGLNCRSQLVYVDVGTGDVAIGWKETTFVSPW